MCARARVRWLWLWGVILRCKSQLFLLLWNLLLGSRRLVRRLPHKFSAVRDIEDQYVNFKYTLANLWGYVCLLLSMHLDYLCMRVVCCTFVAR